MAPKRAAEDKDATEEAPRRSTRTSSKPPSEGKPAAKPASKPKAKPASKKADAAPAPVEEETTEKEDKQEKEAEKPLSEPEAKKQKTSDSVLSVGDTVPDITLKNENDEDIAFASLYEKTGVVVFSYPKANTPGCTTQACGFRDIYDDITQAGDGYTIVGLSADPPKSQLSWKTSKKLQYSLLSDPKKELLKQLGATEATKRCHWVIEKGGKLLEAKIGVKPADDPKNVLAFIKSL